MEETKGTTQQLGTCKGFPPIHEPHYQDSSCVDWKPAGEAGKPAPKQCPTCESTNRGDIRCLVPDHPHPYVDHDYCKDAWHKGDVVERGERAPALRELIRTEMMRRFSSVLAMEQIADFAYAIEAAAAPAQPASPPTLCDKTIRCDLLVLHEGECAHGRYALQSDLLRLVKIVLHILRGFQETANTEAAALGKELEER